jgi:hypothetical protein
VNEMVMTPTKLADGLKAMTPTTNENIAIDRFADAWTNYFYDAVVGAIPVNPGTLTTAKNVMKMQLIGMKTAGAAKIQNGITLFWSTVATAAPTIWTTVPPCTGATPPPTLATIAATLNGVFAANKAAQLNLDAAAMAIAAALHPLNLGGICVIPTPGVATPIT